MVRNSLIEVLASVARVPEAGSDTHTNEGLSATLLHAFGGSIISQALSAAEATVGPGFDAYSPQSSFLRPVKASSKVAYHVDRAADGRTSATRLVRATQGDSGQCLYVTIISFQKRGSASVHDSTPIYAEGPPDIGGYRPDDVSPFDLRQIGFQINGDELPANVDAGTPSIGDCYL